MSKNEQFLSMCITVARHHVMEEDPNVAWGKCQKALTPFESPTDGSLIEDARGCLQVDFANAYIGGGVLNMGNVQVRHAMHRELYIHCLAMFMYSMCERIK